MGYMAVAQVSTVGVLHLFRTLMLSGQAAPAKARRTRFQFSVPRRRRAACRGEAGHVFQSQEVHQLSELHHFSGPQHVPHPCDGPHLFPVLGDAATLQGHAITKDACVPPSDKLTATKKY